MGAWDVGRGGRKERRVDEIRLCVHAGGGGEVYGDLGKSKDLRVRSVV